MIIRPDVVKRANDVLKEWKSASDFTKAFVLIEWSPKVAGITIEEMCIVMFPDEVLPRGAPRARAVRRMRNLIKKVRHHPMNEGMVPFAVQKKVSAHVQGRGTTEMVAWFLKNITEKNEWGKICGRMEKTIVGFRTTMKKFSKIMDKPTLERSQNIEKLMEELMKELKIEEQYSNGPIIQKRRKRKQHPIYDSSEAET